MIVIILFYRLFFLNSYWLQVSLRKLNNMLVLDFSKALLFTFTFPTTHKICLDLILHLQKLPQYEASYSSA